MSACASSKTGRSQVVSSSRFTKTSGSISIKTNKRIFLTF
jgi:hypothetical protein